jgi:uncharacterized membrane protein
MSARGERQNGLAYYAIFFPVGSFAYVRSYFSDRLLGIALLALLMFALGNRISRS